MKVVILCGGQGTRLQQETRPKPLVPIGDRPILWHIMKIYSAFGFNEFILCLGYKGEMIKQYFLNYDLASSDFTIHLGSKEITAAATKHDEHDWTVTLVDTGQSTMTGGRLALIRPYLNCDEPFMVTYGDGVGDIDIGALVEFHRGGGQLATLSGVRPRGRFGELELIDDRVQSFQEKPDTQHGWINGGFFVFEYSVLDYLVGESCVLEQEPLKRLSQDGELRAYRHFGYWQCMDTPRDLEELTEQCKEGNPPWQVW